MKKVMAAILLAASIFTLAACRADGYVDRATLESVQLERDLQAITEIHTALKDFGTDVGDPDDLSIAVAGSITARGSGVHEARTEPGNAQDNTDFNDFPVEEILSLTVPGDNRFTGNYYYVYGLVMEWGILEDGFEIKIIYLDYEENVEYRCMAIVGTDTQEGWDEIEPGAPTKFYIKYTGYSAEHNMPCGYYEFHELYDPFERS